MRLNFSKSSLDDLRTKFLIIEPELHTSQNINEKVINKLVGEMEKVISIKSSLGKEVLKGNLRVSARCLGK